MNSSTRLKSLVFAMTMATSLLLRYRLLKGVISNDCGCRFAF